MEVVDFESANKLLKKYKILAPRTVFVTSKKDLGRARWFKYPLFLKVDGKNILHRTDLGGVAKIENKKYLEKTFSKMMKIKDVDGVLIQEKIEGKELIIGMKKDPQFGPAVMVGIGGLLAETINDFVLRIAPVSEQEALDMLSELKGYSYLLGERGGKRINLKSAAKVIVALSDIGLNEDVKEATLNPVIVDENNALAVDVKFLI